MLKIKWQNTKDLGTNQPQAGMCLHNLKINMARVGWYKNTFVLAK